MARAKKSDLGEIGEAKKAYKEKKAKAEKKVEEQPAAEEVEIPVEVETAEPQDYKTKESEELKAVKAQNEELKAALAQVQAQIAAMQSASPQIIQVAAPSKEKVTFLWQGEVADDNQMWFGENGMYGKIVGKTGTFVVPKDDISRVLDSMNRYFLDKRWLIILDGLTDEERETLGVNYKEGELLDRQAFAKMVDMGEEILKIYPKLCNGHKEMVAKRYYEAWLNRNPHITREVVIELNRMCKAAGCDANSFAPILAEMNAIEADEA